MKKGRLYLIISALIYGLTPVLAKQVTISGGDGATTVFLRSVLALPLLLVMILVNRVSVRLTWKEFVRIVILGAAGFAPSMVLLYASYARGAVGVATMLHFCYPFIIVLVCALVFNEKMPKLKWLGTVLAAVGTILSLDMKTDAVGALLAVVSGAFYAFFVIFLDKSGIDKMNYLKLTFYLSLIIAVSSLGMCITGNGLHFPQDARGWLAAAMISVSITLAAIPLFQIGVKLEGASEAGILSMAEPVASIIIGVTLLGEPVSVIGLTGCAMIAAGVILVEKA